MPMGHNPLTLTSANAVVQMRCKGVYDNYVQLQGFQVDNAWAFGDGAIGETRMGVDGKQSGGYTPHEMDLTIYLEANSSSISVMENIKKDFNANMETRLTEFQIQIDSIKKVVRCSGFMTSSTGGASGQKLLAGSQYVFKVVNNGAEDIA